MPDRWTRWASLTGVLFAVVTLAGVLTAPETPETSDSPAQILHYYTAHRSAIETTSIVVGIGFLLVVFWSGVLRSYLRQARGAEGASALVLAGGIVMAVAALGISGLEYGIAHELKHLSQSQVQTVNFVATELFLPILAGGCIFGVGAGVAILRGAALPRWLGWVVIVIGIAALIPPVAFIALAAFAIWTIVVSIMMFIRLGRPVVPRAEMPQAPGADGREPGETAAATAISG
jgi:hypothetical protein